MTTEPAGSGWRLRWANRQNERLKNAFDASFAAWQRDDDEARRMLRVAAEFHGLSQDQLPPNVGLHRDEIALSVTPGVAMVETANEPALHAPGYAGFSIYQAPPAAPQESTTVDTGVAAVTNKRVVFYGSRKHREWAFAKLIGIAHSPDNRTTLMRVSNRV